MTLEIKRNVNEIMIKVVGRLDTFTSPVLGKTIDRNVPEGKSIVLDLSGLEAISESGVQILLDANKKMQPTGSLRLMGVSEGVMDTLKANGCADILMKS